MEFITKLLSFVLTVLFMKETFWLAVGLFVGWNFLPQPVWVKNLVGKVFSRKVTSPE